MNWYVIVPITWWHFYFYRDREKKKRKEKHTDDISNSFPTAEMKLKSHANFGFHREQLSCENRKRKKKSMRCFYLEENCPPACFRFPNFFYVSLYFFQKSLILAYSVNITSRRIMKYHVDYIKVLALCIVEHKLFGGPKSFCFRAEYYAFFRFFFFLRFILINSWTNNICILKSV